MDATSATTLSSRHHVHISWGKCGIPGSLKIRRFLETMAEEVTVQEGFQYAKILWVLLTKTLYYFSGWPHCLDLLCTATLIRVPTRRSTLGRGVRSCSWRKCGQYVLSRHHQGSKHRGTISRQNDYWERSALGEIVYQKEWKAGVKHIHR